MNENDIKWISVNNLRPEPLRVALSEKLEKFGWCVDFSGFGEGKAEKAQLCIFDVLSRKEKPNILIISPSGFAQSWYNALLMGLGVDFKLVSGAKNAVAFFARELSNLFIVSEDVLAGGEQSVFEAMQKSGIVWDLMIVDASGSTEGISSSMYIEKTGMKTDELLIFAPYPALYTESPVPVNDVVKALLNKEAAGVSDIAPKLSEFTVDSPYLNCPTDTSKARVNIVSYAFDRKIIPDSLKMADQHTGGRYINGGNVFEEYNLDARRIYLRPTYTRAEAEILKNTDQKLGAFMKLIDPVITGDSGTAIVYFSSDVTLNYVEKVLSAIYYDKTANIMTCTKNLFDVRRMKQWYESVPEQKIRIVLAKDSLDETIGLYSPVTHIINYELPDNPAVLQQRYMRRGLLGGDAPEFILFMDDNGCFDSRILKKTLVGNLYKAFRRDLPTDNIMFRIDGIENMIADMLSDIKYISDYTGAVGSSFDVISRFRNEYNIPAERNLNTAARTHEYSKNKLSLLASAFGVTELLDGKAVDREALISAVKAKLDEIRGGFTAFDEKMSLVTIKKESVYNDELKKFTSRLAGCPYYTGLERAKEKLNGMVDGSKRFPYMKGETAELSDIMTACVLYNAWLYWRDERSVGGSYAEFIKAYNEGVV